MEYDLKEITRYLPDGWEEAAKDKKALLRSRNIKTAEQLLSLLLTYLSGNGSFMDTSVQMSLSGLSVTKNATVWRVLSSGEWLRWLAENLSKTACGGLEKPEFLNKKSLILVDASDELVKNRIQKGGKRKLWRLHYAFDLFNFCCKEMQLTEAAEGEKLTRYTIEENEIYVADRVYSTIKGIEHIKQGGGYFVLRLKSNSFNLYDKVGEKIDVLPILSELGTYENISIDCFYKDSEQELCPIRIVAMKKDEKAIHETVKRMNRKKSKKQEMEVSAETKEFNEYILTATNLSYTNEQILEIYRTRCQIEMLFFRLKSLFGYGNAPIEKDKSAKAWFYGKIFIAALCETILKREAFSPEAEELVKTIDRTESGV